MLSVQERLTKQIAQALTETITPHGVGVVIEATYVVVDCQNTWLGGVVVTASDYTVVIERSRVRLLASALPGSLGQLSLRSLQSR